MHPSKPPHTPLRAASPIIIDLSTPSPPSIPLPSNTPQHQKVPRSPTTAYSAPSTSNRTPWWLNTTPDSHNTSHLQNMSGSHKNIPAFTPAQHEYIIRLSRQGLTLKKIQEEFSAAFPGNQKEPWEISRIRTAAITIRKGEPAWDVEDGTRLAKRMAKQAEARKRAKARKKEFAAVASGERPFFKLSADKPLVEEEEDGDIETNENALKVHNAVEDSPLVKRERQGRDTSDRKSPTLGRGNRDGSVFNGLLAEIMAGSDEEDEEDEDEREIRGSRKMKMKEE